MVEIVGKSYKQIQVKGEVSQLEFLEATEEAWDYVAGSHTYWDKNYVCKDGSIGADRVTTSWPDHKEAGGILSLKEGYTIMDIEKVRKGNWGLHIDTLFYTNIHFLLTQHSKSPVTKYGLFFGNVSGTYNLPLAWDYDYESMTEITKYQGVGFSFCIVREDGVIVTQDANQIAENLGINTNEWDLKWAQIFIPA